MISQVVFKMLYQLIPLVFLLP